MSEREVDRCEILERVREKRLSLILAAELMNVDASDCLVFEDTHAGVLAGKAAGMGVIAIFDAVSEEYMEEIKNSADHYLMCFSELV